MLQPCIYNRVVTDRILPGVIAQDAFTVVFALVTLALAWRVREGETKLVGLVGTPAVFVPLWASQIVPLIRAGERLDYLFSIYILDLCFIMPAFLIVALLTHRRDVLGYALTPAMFFVGFAVLAPLAVAELLRQALVGQPMDTASFSLFLVLSVVYLALAALTSWGFGRKTGGRARVTTGGSPG